VQSEQKWRYQCVSGVAHTNCLQCSDKPLREKVESSVFVAIQVISLCDRVNEYVAGSPGWAATRYCTVWRLPHYRLAAWNCPWPHATSVYRRSLADGSVVWEVNECTWRVVWLDLCSARRLFHWYRFLSFFAKIIFFIVFIVRQIVPVWCVCSYLQMCNISDFLTWIN